MAAAPDDERRHPVTARAHVRALCDPGTFTELFGLMDPSETPPLGPDAREPDVVGGFGSVAGRPVCVVAQCVPPPDGGLGWVRGAEKLALVLDTAVRMDVPLVVVDDGGRPPSPADGVEALAAAGRVLCAQVAASGAVPQVVVTLRPGAGVAATCAAQADLQVRVGEDDPRAHLVASDVEDAFDCVRRLVSYLPSSATSELPVRHSPTSDEPTDADLELDGLLPRAASQPYDVRDVVERVLDDGVLLELQPGHAANIVTGLGEVGGVPVGVVANQPSMLAGTLDIDASEKAARFVRTCDAFHLPVVTFVDVPGFLPGVDQEQQGIIRRGAKLLFAYAEATVPLVTVTMRKAFGGAQVVMGSRHLGADLSIAWPSAQIAVMGAAGAVQLVHRAELARVRAAGGDETARLAALAAEYEERLLHPYVAASRGFVDMVVEPHRTRLVVTAALHALSGKRSRLAERKHENVPL